MEVNLVAIAVLVVLGVAAFLFSVLYGIMRVFGGVGKALGRLFRTAGPTRDAGHEGAKRVRRMCANPRCRVVDARGGRFCAQCGAPQEA